MIQAGAGDGVDVPLQAGAGAGVDVPLQVGTGDGVDVPLQAVVVADATPLQAVACAGFENLFKLELGVMLAPSFKLDRGMVLMSPFKLELWRMRPPFKL